MVSILVIVCSLAVVAGIGLGIFFGLKGKKNHTPSTSQTIEKTTLTNRKNWNELISTQILRDQLTVKDLVMWINTFKPELTQDDCIFVFKANKVNVERTGYEYSEMIDDNTNYIACVINQKNNTISHQQLFTFGTVDEQLNKLFGDYDYAKITL